MPDFQTFIVVITTLLAFLTGVVLNYDTIEFRNYQIIIPQWFGLLFAGITFSFVAVDQLLRGFVRLEEVQRKAEEEQRRIREEQRRIEEEQRRIQEEQRRIQEEQRRIQEEQRRVAERDEARTRSLETAERETRRTRIETRYRVAIIRFGLNPNNLHRRQLADILALLEEYQDTL